MTINFYRNVGMPFCGDDYEGGIGGLETQAIGLGRELARRGHEVTLYVNCLKPGVYDGVVYKQASEYKDDADVLIGISTIPPASKSIRVSWTHTPGTECHSPELDIVVCNSQWTLAHYIKHRPANNYIVIPNGFSYNRYINRVPKKRNSIILAGSILKGFREAPEIFKQVKAQMPTATFDIYGGAKLWDWSDEKYQDVYAAMEKVGINYHGVVSREKIVAAYQKAEVYFSPMCDFRETFGLAIIESMASGCVPVCSKVGNQTNLLTENSGILLDEGANEARAIVNLLKDRTTLNRLSEGARQEVRKYDWPVVVSQWEEKVFKL